MAIKGKRATRALSLAYIISLIYLISIISVSAITIDSDLDLSQQTANGHFRIHYTDDCTAHPDKCITGANVNDLDSQLEDIYGIYTDTTGDFRFSDPTWGAELPIQIHPTDGGGMAYCDGTGCGISLAPQIFVNNLNLEAIPLHEMLHQVEWRYGGWSGLVTDGTARMMQDKIYADLDGSNGAGTMAAYFPESNWFLMAGTDKPLIDQSYSSCLFWTYLTERYGAVTAEPQRGIDFIREVYSRNGGGSDDRQRINAALGQLSPGTTFTDAFADFIVANYAKDLTGSNVPAEYRYIDDDQQPGAYSSPKLSMDRTMPVGDSVTATDEIRDWSAKYYVVRPSADSPIVSVDFRQTAASNVQLIYNLLVIDNDDLIMGASEFDVRGRDFIRSFPNHGYDRVVVVVGAAELPAAYRYTFSTGGGLPTLNILWPKGSDPARVDTGDLNNFQVHLEVLGPGGSMNGLDPEDFTVTVGGTDFDVVTGTEVMGQYWLAVQPANLAAGTYDLQVSMAGGSISDSEANAVVFEDVINSDSMLVIDRSGTMLEPAWTGPAYETPDPTDKIYGAIDAATLYLNSFRTGDMVGLIWFSSDAVTSRALSSFTEANRLDITNAINALDQDEAGAWLATSIGDGIYSAQDQLDSSGSADHNWWIVVLSDGLENTDKWIKDVVCDSCKIDYDASTNNPAKIKTRIHSVALGSNADRERLEQLASQSGGRFEYVIEPHSGDLPNDLADVYRAFAETALLEQRIAAIRGSYMWNDSSINHTINMEKGATEATFVVNYNWRGVPSGGPPAVTLWDPAGSILSPTITDDTHQIFKVPLPADGPWTVNIGRAGPVEFPNQGSYLIEASVKSKATLEVFLGLPPEKRKIGSSLPILAFLTDTEPIAGASISLQVMTPEVETALVVLPSEEVNIGLYDDGAHGDGKADDGIYGCMFTRTARTGVYDARVRADAYSPLVGNFHREARLAFNMRTDDDGDGDGLPDGWEEEHGLNPADGVGDSGPGGDPDGDGLTNAEELKAGTDPRNSDTDGGGESDGSEVSGGRDPNDPGDDAVLPPTSLRAIPGVGSVILNIGVLPLHDYLVLYRSKSPSGPWDPIVIDPAVFSYTDSGLENGVTYYYRATGVVKKAQPVESSPTRTVSATPGADPIPPSGYLIINGGETSTRSDDVTLNIWADPDTVEMLISNYPDLSNSTWEPFGREKQWSLIPGDGLRTVYVIFRDGAGNIGPRSPNDPSVELEPAMASINLRRDLLAEIREDCSRAC